MKIPTEPVLREGFYEELITQCLCSRENRFSEYERMRYYYLFGVDGNNAPAIFNKIYPSIDTLVSFLFAVDTTRFSIELGAAVPKAELAKVPPMVQRLNDKWHDSNADLVFSDAVTWSLVYGSTFIKTIQRNKNTVPYLLLPHNFGVFDEAQTMLSRQEAMVQVYTQSRASLERNLKDHPQEAAIMARVSTSATPGDTAMAAGVQRIIMNSQYPLSSDTFSGNVNDVLGGTTLYRPVTQEQMILMYELWLWDDSIDGYRVVTMAEPNICIYDRAAANNMFLPGEHPFTQVCPNPAPDYFWGYSEVQKLSKLQDLREHHLEQVNRMVDLNVNPPKALQGQWGAIEEKNHAMRSLGAILSSTDPGVMAKVTEFKPQIPTDLWQIIVNIDDMFDETISLNNLSKGRGDTGVRSKGQTESLLRVGSSRPKKRALVIEDSLEHLADLYVKLDQQHNPDHLKDEAGQPFIAEQFTKDFMTKVDAHSSSPIFVEEMRMEAFELFSAGVIDGEDLLDMLRPQNVQVLKVKYKAMAARRAAAEAQAAQQQQMETKLKSVGGGKPSS